MDTRDADAGSIDSGEPTVDGGVGVDGGVEPTPEPTEPSEPIEPTEPTEPTEELEELLPLAVESFMLACDEIISCNREGLYYQDCEYYLASLYDAWRDSGNAACVALTIEFYDCLAESFDCAEPYQDYFETCYPIEAERSEVCYGGYYGYDYDYDYDF